MMPRRQRRGHDLRAIRECHGLIGVDEAGRGALAGPVVAGAVLLNRTFLHSDWCRRHAATINDSKLLTPEEREQLYARMEWLRSEHRILFAAGVSNVAEIESENVLGATKLAMRRAIESVLALGHIQSHPPDPLFETQGVIPRAEGECISDWMVLVDGKPLRGLGFTHRAIVEGDAKSLVIALASIVAKVSRDRLMRALDVEVPGYGFAKHKGYATGLHREALVTLGATSHHRSLFIRTFLDRGEDPGQAQFDFFDAAAEAIGSDPESSLPV